MSDKLRSVEPLLPLKPKVLHILLAVADGPRHGYSIMQEVAERTEGQVRLWPAALYGFFVSSRRSTSSSSRISGRPPLKTTSGAATSP